MKRNSGFSLVELMVALVVGLIIILGAGQLFLTVFQTNRQVETLSEKQAAVNFAVETLLRDVRRADIVSISTDGEELSLRVPNRGDIGLTCGPGDRVRKVYKLSDSEVSGREGWALMMGLKCDAPVASSDFQQVVVGLTSNGFVAVDDGNGALIITLELVATDGSGASDPLVFYAVNRAAAVNN
ncbi:MAG: PilW family protein [Pseudomonadota bacterium]